MKPDIICKICGNKMQIEDQKEIIFVWPCLSCLHAEEDKKATEEAAAHFKKSLS